MIVRGLDANGDWWAYAGDRNIVRWQFLADGTPVNITGVTVSAQARKTDTATTVGVAATCTIVNAATGTVDIAWNGESIRTLLKGKSTWTGVWDLQLLWPGGSLPETVHRGKFHAQMDVTRTP